MVVIYSPQGMLGYGYPLSSLKRALDYNPDVIGVDAGSTDAGPYRLGSGKPTVGEKALKRDLEYLLKASYELKIPLIIGSAGGAGSREHVEWTKKIIFEISRKEKLSFNKIALIYTDIEKSWLINKLKEKHVKPLGPVNELTEDEILKSSNIVAVCGVEPFIEALEKEAQIIICGRSNDPAIFASFAIIKGISKGTAFHAGKILECGALAAVPSTASDGMLAFLEEKSFTVEPSSSKRVCTKLSVAAHSLYEKEHPYRITFPEGTLDVSKARFIQKDKRKVKVENSLFEESKELLIKIEGAKRIGERYICICTFVDKNMLEAKNTWINETRSTAHEIFKNEAFSLNIYTYGENPYTLIIEAISEDKELAKTICSWTRSFIMHYHYPGRKATSGNLALMFSPSELYAGEAFTFNIHHLVKIETQKEIYQIIFDKV